MASCQPSPRVSGCPPGREPPQPGIRPPVHQPRSRLHSESSTPSAQSSQTLWLVPPHQASSPSSEATLLPSASDRSFQGCRAMAEQKARILTQDRPQFSLHHVRPWLCVLILQTPMPAPPEQVLPTPNLPGPQLPHGHKQGDGARLSGPMRLPCTRDAPPAEVRGSCPGPLPQKSQPGTGGSAGADPP